MDPPGLNEHGTRKVPSNTGEGPDIAFQMVGPVSLKGYSSKQLVSIC